MNSSLVRIAFGVDRPYVPHLGAVIASLAAASPRTRLHFLILYTGIDLDDQRRIQSCAPRMGFDWVKVSDPVLVDLPGRLHISGATFYRLALSRLAPPEVERILYLDGDLIVVRDIGELFRTELYGQAIGAVYDAGIDAVPFAKRWGLVAEPGAYFNAGVLLLDLALVRSRCLFDKALDFALQNQAELSFMDQDALNHINWRQWRQLDPAWNVQRNMIIDGMPSYVANGFDPRRRPALVHFTTEHKPWLPETYHPYAWLYWRNLARTPFLEQVEATYGVSRRARLRLFARCAKRWPFLKSSMVACSLGNL